MDDPHHLGLRSIKGLGSTCPRCHDLMLERVERYSKLGSDVVRWLGADDRIEPAAVVRPVAGGWP
jgi:hypothetical protein